MAAKHARSETLLSGALGGAAAYVVAYVVTFVLVRGEAREAFEGTVPTWKVVGWYLYNAHFVDLVSSQSFGAFGGSEAVSLIAESSGTTATLLYGVPPLALLAVGAAVALRLDDGDLTDLALGGAATVLGYGLLAVVGAIAFGHSVEGSFLGVEVAATVSLPLASVVVVVALLYPGVFGTAGAVVAPAVRDAAAG
jgi:hypothetical protein